MPFFWEVRRARARGEPRASYFPRLRKKLGPPLHLLLGMGGTGKTEMIKVLEIVLLREGIGRIVFLASMGVAAALLPHGNTICTGAGLNPTVLRSDDAHTTVPDVDKRTLLAELHGSPDDIVCVVIDEISFVTASEIHHLSDRVVQWLELPHSPELPFGGVPTIFMGHFFQLPPPRAASMVTSIVHSMLPLVPVYGKRVKSKPTKPPRAGTASQLGAQIMAQARRFDLVTQMRAALDERHRRFAAELCRVDVPFPVSAEYLRWLGTRELADRSNPELAFAPHGVREHVEGNLLQLHLLRDFARHHNRPLVRWRIDAPECMLALGKDVVDGMYVHEAAALYCYWVEGMPTIIMQNVCTAAGVTNGTRGYGHSLTLDPKELDKAPDGEVLADGTVLITLRQKPFSVNVRLTEEHSNALHLRLLRERNVSLGDNDVIVPIVASDRYQHKLHFASPFAAENHLAGNTEVSHLHPVMPDLANTDYKFQGCTIPKYFVVNLRRLVAKGSPGVRASRAARAPHAPAPTRFCARTGDRAVALPLP